MAEALARQLPDSTLVDGVMLPTTRAAIALQRGRPAEAVEALRAAVAYEAGNVAVLIPRYLRGEAYLGTGEAARALEEFQGILAAARRRPLLAGRGARAARRGARARRARRAGEAAGLRGVPRGVDATPTATFRSC